MKNPSGSTFQRTTSPEHFRAVATGVGVDIRQSAITGEARKALVRADPASTIATAIPNEGFGPATMRPHSSYPKGKCWYGTFGDEEEAINGAGR